MRVITGAWKGRRLATPSWEGLRPTSDRLRETLFNVLGPAVVGARVLDAFAGTGAVGIEALSRGAAHVTFLEHDRRAVALIERNLATCRADQEAPRRYTVVTGDATRWRAPAGAAFTLVWLDPPYAERSAGPTLAAIRPALTADGTAVLEHATRRAPDVPEGWTVTRTLVSGDSTLTFLRPIPGTR
ncbi:MAG: 16S rRNA (guanine(966)-N(2))-methyltransferase RsmD [Vicinamibacterales bacterium]